MRFIWDENKNRTNRAKHRISFEKAARAFDDPGLLTRPDSTHTDEERWQSLGYVGATLLAITHTYRVHEGEEICRIISARKATMPERKLYEEEP